MDDIIKICKKHGNLTIDHVKQGIYKGKKYKKCNYCEIERSRFYYSKKYQEPDFLDNKRKKNKIYWNENKSIITKKRQTPERKEKRRQAYIQAGEKYRKIYRDKQTEYRKSLADPYMKKIISNGKIDYKYITKEIIYFKRSLILLKKGINKHIILEKISKKGGNNED